VQSEGTVRFAQGGERLGGFEPCQGVLQKLLNDK